MNAPRLSRFSLLPFLSFLSLLASTVPAMTAGCLATTSGCGSNARPGGAGGGGGTGPSGLPTPPGPGNVPRPAGPPGNLTVLDWAGFKSAVSYTFDDANSSQIAHYAALQALGVPMTFYLITSKAEASNPIWAQAVSDGHELGNHTRSHAQTGTADEFDAATSFIEQRYAVTVWTGASPYGDASYPPLAATRFLANRGVSNANSMAPNDSTDPFNLFCFIPDGGAVAAAFNAEIDAAHTAGRWKTVLVHGFTGGSDSAYQPVAIGEFTASVTHTKSLGDVWIDTVAHVAAYWRAQKQLSTVIPVTSGDTTTWTWALQAHFPPGRYLRVKVDGGTLTQGGSPLTWDGHGYYEVALDAGSVTLAP